MQIHCKLNRTFIIVIELCNENLLHASNPNFLILKSFQPDFVDNWLLKQWTARSDSKNLKYQRFIS